MRRRTSLRRRTKLNDLTKLKLSQKSHAKLRRVAKPKSRHRQDEPATPIRHSFLQLGEKDW